MKFVYITKNVMARIDSIDYVEQRTEVNLFNNTMEQNVFVGVAGKEYRLEMDFQKFLNEIEVEALEKKEEAMNKQFTAV